jgi:hypothetical protein
MTEAETTPNQAKMHSQMIRAFCRAVNPMLPMPVAEVKQMLRRYQLPARTLALPRRLATVVVVRTDGNGTCVWVGPA